MERSDSVISRGREAKPPRLYDHMMEVSDPLAHWLRKRSRRLARDEWNETEERLKVREAVATARLSLKRRSA